MRLALAGALCAGTLALALPAGAQPGDDCLGLAWTARTGSEARVLYRQTLGGREVETRRVRQRTLGPARLEGRETTAVEQTVETQAAGGGPATTTINLLHGRWTPEPPGLRRYGLEQRSVPAGTVAAVAAPGAVDSTLSRFVHDPPTDDPRPSLKPGRLAVLEERVRSGDAPPVLSRTRIQFVGIESLPLPTGPVRACRFDETPETPAGPPRRVWLHLGTGVMLRLESGPRASLSTKAVEFTVDGAVPR